MKFRYVPVLLLFLLLSTMSASAQIFPVDTLLYNGDPNSRINLVILADGYQLPELDKFVEDCKAFLDQFFQTEPFSSYKNYVNVFAVKVPSNESGASHPGTAPDEPGAGQPTAQVDNYFGTTFDYGGIHRLLAVTKGAKVTSVLAANFPAYDQVYVLVNTPYYGGSGGAYATGSTNVLSGEIAIHELGHSFAGLADEYYAGDIYAHEAPNMTMETDPTLVKWHNWLDVEEVGIYQHCCGGNSASWYKPHRNCKMQALTNDFCPVCKETLVERIHDLVGPIDAYRPMQLDVPENIFPRTFSLSLVKPEPNTLQVTWSLNGAVIRRNVDSVVITRKALLEGGNRLVASVVDTTSFSRAELHPSTHHFIVEWIIHYSSALTVTESSLRHIVLGAYPNPSSGTLNLDYELDRPSSVRVEVLNLNGQLIKEEPEHSESAGRHRAQLDLSAYPDGPYFIRLTVDGILFKESIVKVK